MASFLIAETIAKKGKPFSDGQLVKDCLQILMWSSRIRSLSWKMSVFLTKLLLEELMTWQQILCRLAEWVTFLHTAVMATVVMCRVRYPACTAASALGKERHING